MAPTEELHITRPIWFIAIGLVVAACGGDGAAAADEGVASLTDDTTATTISTEISTEEAARAFTQCMRDNGVAMEDPTVDADGNVIPGRPSELPDPGEGQGGGFGDEMRAAFETCGGLLGDGGFGFTSADQSELQDQLVALADCLRDQGLDVSDPDLSALGGPGAGGDGPGEGGTPGGPFGLDFADPEVEAALDACADVVPNIAGGPGGPGANGPATSGDS